MEAFVDEYIYIGSDELSVEKICVLRSYLARGRLAAKMNASAAAVVAALLKVYDLEMLLDAMLKIRKSRPPWLRYVKAPARYPYYEKRILGPTDKRSSLAFIIWLADYCHIIDLHLARPCFPGYKESDLVAVPYRKNVEFTARNCSSMTTEMFDTWRRLGRPGIAEVDGEQIMDACTVRPRTSSVGSDEAVKRLVRGHETSDPKVTPAQLLSIGFRDSALPIMVNPLRASFDLESFLENASLILALEKPGQYSFLQKMTSLCPSLVPSIVWTYRDMALSEADSDVLKVGKAAAYFVSELSSPQVKPEDRILHPSIHTYVLKHWNIFEDERGFEKYPAPPDH